MQSNLETKKLLEWYQNNKRNLPFRNTKDPYKIWLSEIMLQQTKVDMMIPYYKRWVKIFPKIKDVAESELSDLLILWQGLGYYARCRNFHKATKIVLDVYDGKIPKDFNLFKSLPGVGDYTAGAVLSIAFGISHVAIDGNVKRIMSRFLALRIMSTRNLNIIANFLKRQIPRNKASIFNQAIMELGALVCRPVNPKCDICPLKLHCKAKLRGFQSRYPQKKIKSPRPHLILVGCMLWRKDRFIIQKRNNKSMLGGLWEIPNLKLEDDRSKKNNLKVIIKKKFGAIPTIIKKIGSVEHTYSHFSITFHVYHCKENAGKLRKENEIKWIKPTEIPCFAFSKVNHKIFDLIKKQGWNV